VVVALQLEDRACMETTHFDLPAMPSERLDGPPRPSAVLTILARITLLFAALSLALLVTGLVLDDAVFLTGGALALLAFPPLLLVVVAALPWER
jgi:hypothetical protein